MTLQIATIENVCSQRSDIAAYVDGELPAREELELEMHLAVCKDCADELNEQKKLLQALNYALDGDGEIELPENFTRVVVANAESKVSGLRRPQERSKALFICLALLLVGLLGLGAETGAALNAATKFAERFLAVGSFVLNLVYDVFVGAAVILRSLGHQIVFNSNGSFAILAGFVFVSLVILSCLTTRSNRS